jgi:hypothetical protein
MDEIVVISLSQCTVNITIAFGFNFLPRFLRKLVFPKKSISYKVLFNMENFLLSVSGKLLDIIF